jgi:hypothetical protein
MFYWFNASTPTSCGRTQQGIMQTFNYCQSNECGDKNHVILHPILLLNDKQKNKMQITNTKYNYLIRYGIDFQLFASPDYQPPCSLITSLHAASLSVLVQPNY